jgi:hypothetical protein
MDKTFAAVIDDPNFGPEIYYICAEDPRAALAAFRRRRPSVALTPSLYEGKANWSKVLKLRLGDVIPWAVGSDITLEEWGRPLDCQA